VAGPGSHHGGTGRGEIHLPPCDEDQEGVDGDSQRRVRGQGHGGTSVMM